MQDPPLTSPPGCAPLLLCPVQSESLHPQLSYSRICQTSASLSTSEQSPPKPSAHHYLLCQSLSGRQSPSWSSHFYTLLTFSCSSARLGLPSVQTCARFWSLMAPTLQRYNTLIRLLHVQPLCSRACSMALLMYTLTVPPLLLRHLPGKTSST